MAVKVKIPTMMRQAVGGAPVVESDGDTVRDVIADIERRYPALAGSILGRDGGREGLPVVRLGRQLRVPRHALKRLMDGLPPAEHPSSGPARRTGE